MFCVLLEAQVLFVLGKAVTILVSKDRSLGEPKCSSIEVAKCSSIEILSGSKTIASSDCRHVEALHSIIYEHLAQIKERTQFLGTYFEKCRSSRQAIAEDLVLAIAMAPLLIHHTNLPEFNKCLACGCPSSPFQTFKTTRLPLTQVCPTAKRRK